MVAALGVVVFPTWQAVLLIMLCFVSLAVALYCLLFMVPLKSFVQRIDSLGGGMRGIQAHVDGVRGEVDQKIAAIESRLSEQEAGLQKFALSLQKLEASVRDASGDARKTATEVHALRADLADLRKESSVLEGRLEGSVRNMVSENFEKVESTVLSALESVEDEMLRGATRIAAARDQRPMQQSGAGPRLGGTPTPTDSWRRPGGKIIPAASLFAAAEKQRSAQAPAPQPERHEPAEVTQEDQGAPAK